MSTISSIHDPAQETLVYLFQTDVPVLFFEQCTLVRFAPRQQLKEFSEAEWTVLLTLLRSFPHVTPYDVLLASLTPQMSQEQCRERLAAARRQSSEAWTKLFLSAKRTLERVEMKIVPFDLTILRSADYGYSVGKVQGT